MTAFGASHCASRMFKKTPAIDVAGSA
jgi:hypothetical protein